MGKLDFYDRGPDRPWPNPLLTSAAIVGHTTGTSARIWARVWEPGKYWLLVSDTLIPGDGVPRVSAQGGQPRALLKCADGKEVPLAGRLLTRDFRFEKDLTGVFDVSGLTAGARVHYALFCDHDRKNRWELPPDADRRVFTTAPAGSGEIRFGLYSCHMPYSQNGDVVNLQMWERFGEELAERQAHFLIGAGDQVYTDGNKKVSIWRWLRRIKDKLLKEKPEEQDRIMRSWFRDIYRGYWGFPALRNVFSRFPTYMIWDDHEIMDGWGSYSKKELANRLDTLWEWENSKQNRALAYRMFDAAKETYFEYQHCHNPQTPDGQYDYSFTWGDFAFYVFDMRGQRDYNRKEDDKILGKEQMKRFLAWIGSPEAAAARALFIVSPVPVVHVAEFVVNKLDLMAIGLADDLRDEWAHGTNRIECDRMLDAVFAHYQEHGRTIAFLSGDVHIGAAFRLSRAGAPKARVYQLTSSGITYSAPGILELLVKDSGKLGEYDESGKKVPLKDPTAFVKLHTLNRNNFGIITARPDADDGAEVFWDLYGSTGQEGEIVRLKRVALD